MLVPGRSQNGLQGRERSEGGLETEHFFEHILTVSGKERKGKERKGKERKEKRKEGKGSKDIK